MHSMSPALSSEEEATTWLQAEAARRVLQGLTLGEAKLTRYSNVAEYERTWP